MLWNMPLGFSHQCMSFSQTAALYFICLGLVYISLVTDLVLDFSHDVQIWKTWFHHQHISSFPHISLLQHRATLRPPAPASTWHLHPKRTQINLPQLEWQVLSLQVAADSSVCPRMQAWTVQHLCVRTQQGAPVYSHFKGNSTDLLTPDPGGFTYLKGP